MKINGYRHWAAALVSVVVHLLILLALYFLYLERVHLLPKMTEIEIVPMELLSEVDEESNSSSSSGVEGTKSVGKAKTQPMKASESIEASPKITKQQSKSITAKPAPPVVHTQNYQESPIATEETKKRKEVELQAEVERQKKRKEEDDRLAAEKLRKEEEARRAEALRRANTKVSSAFASNSFSGNGNADVSASESVGRGNDVGSSVGAGSHTLSGRSIISNGGRLTMPTVKKAIRGRVNVRIIVDETGKVISAEVSPAGTNIADAGARAAAIAAARQTVFNAQHGSTAQKGIITYNFEIQ